MSTYTDEQVTPCKAGWGLVLTEYQVSLQIANRGLDGRWYQMWVYPSYWRVGKPTPGEKPRCVNVLLGTREDAVEILTKLLKDLDEVTK